MKKIIRRILLDRLNLFPATLTDRGELITLIQRLHPIPQEKELKRLGPKGDGGYLVPNDLEGIIACFPPGVSSITGFEKDCANLGMKVFMADGSVDGPIDKHKIFFFIKKYIGAKTSDNFITMDGYTIIIRKLEKENNIKLVTMSR